MTGVLLGFGVVAVIAAVGFATAALLPGEAARIRQGLTPVIYYITNPALMLVLVAGTDLGTVLGVYTPVALATAAVAGAVCALYSGLVLRRRGARTAAAAMAASYVNAGNIGLPIALYAVGSAAPVVSVLLAQLLVLAPLYLALFSLLTRSAGSGSLWRAVARSVANPVTIGTALGVLLSATGLELPEVLWVPLEMLGESSVPLLLLVFGMSLHGQRPFRQRALVPDVVGATLVKLTVMPAAAWALGRFGFGLDGTELLGVVVMAALPTAQNVFLFSSQFRMPTAVVRDVVLLSSLLSFPAIALIGVLLA